MPRDATPDAAPRSGTLVGLPGPAPGREPTAPEDADPWATPAPFLTPGATIGDRYRLVRRIARGGMGSIWSAVDATLDRRVAVKFLSADLADDAIVRERFDREARALAALRTPHVATVFDHGIEQGLPFIVMELLEGEDLQVRLAAGGPLDLPEASAIVSQVARALKHAHAAGIVHRDLKPENVFLARTADEATGEIVKVVDFGVAKLLSGPRSTAAGVLVGSPHCMSPEQIRGSADVDARADVWGLGVLTFVMLTGRRPFEGGMGELAIRITRGDRARVTDLEPSLPRGVDDVLDRALEPDRARRFATVSDLAEALERVSAAALVAPVVRESLDTIPPHDPPSTDTSSEPPAPTRPSQRPTVLSLEPVHRDLLPTPVQLADPALADAELVEQSRLPSVRPAAPPAPEAPSGAWHWSRVVAALAGVFLLLLVVALVWTP